MTQPLSIITSGPEQTRGAGETLGQLVAPGDVVALTGDLGAGKTVLVQGIASGLGIIGHVPSPTFNILLVHRAPIVLYHFDLYRLDEARQLADIDFYETLESDGVSVIEWADRFPEQLPPDRLEVTIVTLDESNRDLQAVGTGPRSRKLARDWDYYWRHRTGGRRP